MKPVCVYQMVEWLKKSDPSISLYLFFKTAYILHFGYFFEQVVTTDLADMAKFGRVPMYVVVFMRKSLYPKMVHHNPTPTLDFTI